MLEKTSIYPTATAKYVFQDSGAFSAERLNCTLGSQVGTVGFLNSDIPAWAGVRPPFF